MEDREYQIANEELKRAENVISNYESSILKRHGWMISAIIGISYARIKNEPYLTPGLYLALGLLTVLLFWSTEMFLRAPHNRAILRMQEIENALRNGRGYYGPTLSDALGGKIPYEAEYKYLFRVRVFMPYLIATMSILLISVNTDGVGNFSPLGFYSSLAFMLSFSLVVLAFFIILLWRPNKKIDELTQDERNRIIIHQHRCIRICNICILLLAIILFVLFIFVSINTS